MPVLLHLDSSPMGEQSVSRRLSWEFTRMWRDANPEGHVIYRDLTRFCIPTVDEDWVAANPAGQAAEGATRLAGIQDLQVHHRSYRHRGQRKGRTPQGLRQSRMPDPSSEAVATTQPHRRRI